MPSTTTMSSREFNQHTARAKKLARTGPVLVTDRGEVTHVLLSKEEYEHIVARRESAADLLAHPASKEIEFSPKAPESLLRVGSLD